MAVADSAEVADFCILTMRTKNQQRQRAMGVKSKKHPEGRLDLKPRRKSPGPMAVKKTRRLPNKYAVTSSGVTAGEAIGVNFCTVAVRMPRAMTRGSRRGREFLHWRRWRLGRLWRPR